MAGVSITTGGQERVAAASQLFSGVFANDPVMTYMLCSMKVERRLIYLPKYFDCLLTAAGMNKAIFHEADQWNCCGVLMPPGSRVDNIWTLLPAGFIPMLWNIGFRGCQRMMAEYTPISDASKLKGLAGQKKYYYVFFIGTAEEARGRGLCSAIMKEYQEIAARDNVPIWLEATTEKSLKLYTSLGWEVVDELVIGKGKADANGMRLKGGSGVTIWTMVWQPKPGSVSQ